MIVYLDASALVKRYVAENYTQEVRSLIRRARMVATTELSRIEVVAAIMRAVRTGNLISQEASKAIEVLRSDWADTMSLKVSGAILTTGEHAVFTHPLKGYDAIHLASAIIWREALRTEITLACFDSQLRRAAKAEKFRLWPPDPK